MKSTTKTPFGFAASPFDKGDQKILKILYFLIFNFSLLTFNLKSASAQTSLGLSAIPPRLEFKNAKPGSVITKEIKVRNVSNTERLITVSVKDIIVKDDSGTPLVLEGITAAENRWAASSWLQVSQTQLRLKPGETKALLLTAIIPDEALPGGHYAAVFHTGQDLTALEQTGSSVQTNVGTIIYITVPGVIKESANITDFSAPYFSEYGPIPFKTVVANFSDIHITPLGHIAITDMFGRRLTEVALPETNIFPNVSRTIDSVLPNKWLLGRYKAQLRAGYGSGGNALMATLYFVVIPWRLIVLLLAIVAILLTLGYLLRNPPKTSSPRAERLEKELDTLKKKYQDR